MTLGGKLPAPMPPRRDPKTTLSVGRARAKSMVAGLEGGNFLFNHLFSIAFQPP